MANFQVHLPNYMLNTWNQLTSDGDYSQSDHAALKSVAEQHSGRVMQEAFEASALNALETHLGDAQLKAITQDTVSATQGEFGSATLNISLVDAPQSPQASQQSPPPSNEERLWALNLEKQAAQNRPPSAEDQARFQDIMKRLASHLSTLPAPSAEDVTWANQLKQRVQSQGLEPNNADKLRFQEISLRFALAQEKQLAARLESVEDLGRPVSQDEAAWARQLQLRQQQGQPISERDQARLFQILKTSQIHGIER